MSQIRRANPNALLILKQCPGTIPRTFSDHKLLYVEKGVEPPERGVN